MDMFGGHDPIDPAAGLFAHFAQGFGGPGIGQHLRRPPRDYDEYMKAYSVAMLPGKERANLSYGGKIIMPPSALARLSALDLESPWMFKLSNPANPAAFTHAGVLEFIAEEGVVHLPYWMMKTLRLNEGDPIRITGAELPKGKLVKLQAQSVHFLEISDPKAVLEQALRNFSALTQGDIIEISYNTIIFALLIMEISPSGSGINVVDTDLEVDFAPPVGYVEPTRPKPPPPSTMASKLQIDLDSATRTPGSSRPSSSLSGAFAGSGTGGAVVSKGGDEWESFKGRGETLSGRKTKGRGLSHRKIEDHMEGSRIIRTDKRMVVSNDTLEAGAVAPAPLNLPFGQLFFGFRVVPPAKTEKSASATASTASGDSAPPQPSTAFAGSGQTLSSQSASVKGKGKEKENAQPTSGGGWGKSSRNTLSGSTTVGHAPASPGGPIGVGGARAPRPPVRNPPVKQRQRSPTPDWGVDDDEDVIVIDSD